MNMIRRVLTTCGIAGSIIAGITQTSLAAPLHYSNGVQTISVGVVILDQSTRSGYVGNEGISVAPYAFYNLDQATGIKPIGWSLSNPHAPGIVTNDIYQHWQYLGGTLPTLGAPIGKQNADYWAVHLSQISDSQLSDYNVLLLAPTNVDLSSIERQKLTKFVDQGGILWEDTSGLPLYNHSISTLNGLPGNYNLFSAGSSANVGSDATSQLLQTPYQLSSNDLDAVSSPQGGVLATYYGLQPSSFLAADITNSLGFDRYLGVTFFGNSPMISVDHEGDGYVVVTTMGSAILLNGSAGTGYTAGTSALGTAGLSAAKFAVNVISQRQDFNQPGGGARNPGYNPIDVTAPVLQRWKDESSTVATAPVIFKGYGFVSTSNEIIAYNLKPGTDTDGDGDPDNGIYNANGTINNSYRDYSVGKPYDRIWTSQSMPSPISSPVCAEIADGYKGVTDVVMVIDGVGNLHVFNALPRTSNGFLIGATNDALYTISNPVEGFNLANAVPSYLAGPGYAAGPLLPNPPTVSGDLAFITATGGSSTGGAGPTGAVWIVDLSTGAIPVSSGSPWAIGALTNNPSNLDALPAYTAQATVGFIPIHDNSGGYDRVIYAPGTTTALTFPCYSSLWFGVKGESPASYAVSGNTLTIQTRASTSALWVYPSNPIAAAPSPAMAALFPRLTFLGKDGEPLSNQYVTAAPTQESPGELVYTVSREADFQSATQVVYGIRVDYTIDWGKNTEIPKDNIERGRLTFPVPAETAATEQRVLGPIALTPGGTAVMTVGDPRMGDPDGSLWWINELQGRGAFSVTGRWSLYSAYTMQSTPGSTKENPVFEDSDALQTLIPNPNVSQQMTSFFWTGAPTVAGNQVFATALAMKGSGVAAIPVTVVMAFAAEPQLPSFPAVNLPSSFNIVQPDFDRSSSGSMQAATGPDVSSSLAFSTASGYSGPVAFDTTSGVVSLSSLAPVQVGNITVSDCLNMSAPFLIQSGEVSTVYQPEAHGGTWSPLHWYTINDGTTGVGRPLVTGNTVFMAGTSIIPSLLNNGTFQYSAVINAIDATISPNDPFVVHSLDRPWENQVAVITDTNGNFEPDPHIKMPSSLGLSSFADYKTRLIQQTLGGSTGAFGVVGGGDNLISYGNAGVYGLSRADFSICDNGRYIRTDSNGNPLFASNVALNSGPGGGSAVGNVKPIIRPTRAYPLADYQTLVVDAGANRVMKVDNSGSELRSVDHFIVDPNHLPGGYNANEPKTFNGPLDAITYSNYVYLSNGTAQVTNQGSEEYWVHYLVADTGNNRLVELIDRYSIVNGKIGPLVVLNQIDPNIPTSGTGAAQQSGSVPQIGVLLWQSPATVSGRNFAYNSVSRVFLWQADDSGRYVYVSGVGNTQPQVSAAGLDSGSNLSLGQSTTGNGGIVIFDPSTPSGIQVYNSFDMPDLTGTKFFDTSTGTFDTSTQGSTQAISGAPLTGLRSVSASSTVNGTATGGEISIMVTLSTGVYEFNINPTTSTGDLGTPDWYITSAAYTGLRTAADGTGHASNPVQFAPAYAKRLDSGDVLIVNSYLGSTFGGTTFNGEVIMLNGTGNAPSVGTNNLGFNSQSIHFNLPQGSSGLRPILSPIFADRR